jgi:hypothetical protein
MTMSEFKLKNTIGEGTKISTRRLATNTEFLLAFYKNNSQMSVFGHIVEPCEDIMLHSLYNINTWNWFLSLCQKHFDKLAQTAFLKICFYLVKQILCNFYKPKPILTTLGHRASGFWPRLFLADQIIQDIYIYIRINIFVGNKANFEQFQMDIKLYF